VPSARARSSGGRGTRARQSEPPLHFGAMSKDNGELDDGTTRSAAMPRSRLA
jgi:hypothetical protein